MATIDASTVIYTETALKRLTVPQLKLMCKEKRVVGYSKLAKDHLVQKLLGSQAASNPGSVTATNPSALITKDNVVISPNKVNSEPHSNRAGLARDSSTDCGGLSNQPTVVVQTTGGITARNTGSKENHRNDALSRGALTNKENPYHSTSLKRLSATPQEHPAPKKIRLEAARQLGSVLCSKSGSSMSKTLGPKIRVEATDAFASEQPASSSSVCDITEPNGNRKFKPLVPFSGRNPNVKAISQFDSTPEVSIHNFNKELSGTDLEHLDFAPAQPVLLSTILFPPSMAQRKHIPFLSLILSAISYDDLKTCALVSRAFRYAAYLSASHQLSRKFSGKRLQEILCRYPSNMTNMWPYLFLREKEAISRKTAFERSFLSITLDGIAEVSPHLWHSPDHEKQIVIALRFLMTKLYFLLSTGHGTSECNTSRKPGRILDVSEVIKDEIWKITYSSSTGIQIFHVIEDTCEVIGESGYSSAGAVVSAPFGIRNDWKAYIDEVSARKDICLDGGLLNHLQWSNHEEYDKGISKNWLKRIQAEGKVGVAKRKIAKRYVLACVVANSVSGPWRTANEMAQEFDGRGSVHTKKQSKKLNLFLPMHHHLESLHFTTSNGNALHEALAVVQTPGREYFILRDNGMQVGCEEEGVALVWTKALRCSRNGCVKY